MSPKFKAFIFTFATEKKLLYFLSKSYFLGRFFLEVEVSYWDSLKFLTFCFL